MTAPPGPGHQAREVALRLLLDWDRQKNVYIEHIVHRYLETEKSLEPRDRAFITELCYGVVRHRNTLRHWVERLCHRPLSYYHRTLRVAVSLGLYQRAYLRTPSHAVVHCAVASWQDLMANSWTPRRLREGAGFLNAVLRRACDGVQHHAPDERAWNDRECLWIPGGWARVEGLHLADPARGGLADLLAVKYSHPRELLKVWLSRYELDSLLKMLAFNNTRPSTYLVFRKHVKTSVAVRRLTLAGASVENAAHGAVRVTASGPIESFPGFEQGEFWVQDLTSRRLALLLPKRERATLVDLCAAPGGKLASLLDRAPFRSVLACDRSAARLARLAENLDRLRFDLSNIQVLEIPGNPDQIRIDRSFEQVLVDVPCSNTGVLARRHEARWRFDRERLRELQRTQVALLRAGGRLVDSGGDVLYTTCSIEPAENSEAVHAVLRTDTHLRLLHEVEVLPGEGHGDGGYGALLRRR